MKIIVNGKERESRDNITVAELLSDLNVGVKNIAIELNLKILNKSEYTAVKLKENDRVEIVLPMGGGNRII